MSGPRLEKKRKEKKRVYFNPFLSQGSVTFLLLGAPFDAFGETERKGSHYIQVYEQIVSFVVDK